MHPFEAFLGASSAFRSSAFAAFALILETA